MKKQMIVMAAAALLTGQAQAGLPTAAISHAISEAIGPVVAKIVKGGAANKAVVAGRAAEGAVGANGLQHLAAGDAAKAGFVLPAAEPKPDLASNILAKNRDDANSYKTLRAAAGNGDSTAMLKMSEMTASGRVSDPGEPWHGYWNYRAAQFGSEAAKKLWRDQCSAGERRRATDRWFDFACLSTYGVSSPYRPELLANPIELLANPIGQRWVKQ